MRLLFDFAAAKRGYNLYLKWRHLAFGRRYWLMAVLVWLRHGRHKAKYGGTL